MKNRKNQKLSVTQNSLYNTLGMIVYYICQWAVTMVTVRLTSDVQVGQLQLALTISNMFTALANYNMRSYQVSDLHGEYSAGEYVSSRIITCIAASVFSLLYSTLWGYGWKSIVLITVYQFYRLTESFSDVLHGVDQRHDRMDHVAVSFVSRGILMLAVYYIVLRFTDNVIYAVSAMTCVTALIVLIYDIPVAAGYEKLKPIFHGGKAWKLLLVCLPAVLASIAFTAVVTVPRQFLGEMKGEVLLGYYATVATPLVFIQVLLNGLVNPALGELASRVERQNRKQFITLIVKLIAIPLIGGILVWLGILLAGRQVMTLLYGEKIVPYVGLMYGVILSSVGYCEGCIAMNVLVVFRKMKVLLVISALMLVAAIASVRPLIDRFSADGVSFCISGAYFLFALAVTALVMFWIHGWNRTEEHNGRPASRA